jgi:hypothetical protein
VRDNDLERGLERIARESTSYYLLGFKPPETRADGRFRKIAVKVARPGLRVVARRGYYAPDANAKPAPGPGRDADIQRALDSPFELADVPLRATTHVFGDAAPGKQAVVLTAEADIRGLAFESRGGQAQDTLETMLVVTNRDTAEFFRFDQQFEMSFRPETRARYEQAWFPIRRRLELVPGAYQAKIIARDGNARRIGSLTHDFDVPSGEGLRISTPILGDRLRRRRPRRPRAGAGRAARVRARRGAALPLRGVRRGARPEDGPARRPGRLLDPPERRPLPGRGRGDASQAGARRQPGPQLRHPDRRRAARTLRDDRARHRPGGRQGRGDTRALLYRVEGKVRTIKKARSGRAIA